eukprot:scaffold397491_cov31-Attheya_sp.AAC.1
MSLGSSSSAFGTIACLAWVSLFYFIFWGAWSSALGARITSRSSFWVMGPVYKKIKSQVPSVFYFL